MRFEAEKAAEALAPQGISLEVIDLRTLWPWDRDAVLDSVARTRRLVVAQESVQVGGFASEVAASVSEALGSRMLSPPRRVGAPRIPIAYAGPMEAAYRVGAADIEAAVRLTLTPQTAHQA
jgi:pyruvate dehydrogenase E1 component beta subunit